MYNRITYTSTYWVITVYDIAAELKIQLRSAAPLRDSLIKKGMIYSEKHGRNGFTVPMFDDFMRRAMPEWTAPAPRPVRKPKH